MTAWHNRQRTTGALLSLSLVGGAALFAGALAPTTPPVVPSPAATLAVGWVVAPKPEAASEPVAKPQGAALPLPNTLSQPDPDRKRPLSKEQVARRTEKPVAARQPPSIAPFAAPTPPAPRKKALPAAVETAAAEPTPSNTFEETHAAAPPGHDRAAAERAVAPPAATAPAASAPAALASSPLSPELAKSELKVFCPHRPPPLYPLVARRLGVEGVITLRVTLTGAGTIVAAEVDPERSTTDHPALTSAALEAVRQWRCALPGSSQDRTVTVWQPFRFQLHSG
ncbi:energy transducer TonB [Hydrogenophilus thiooxidans]|uniref:energy transducer TonB n=1 Tax=Hydrogenophilus thiooxidans TaxID=2820326 RepID=UPI001C23C708|nr:energy transducer TonB [Hydrogenophilus thiooxidans]